jgi:transglutaminase-like putative cysteine protease
MWLKVEHTTTFRYAEPITDAFTELRLRPLDDGGQRCSSFQLRLEPQANVHAYRDPFGNDVRHFDVLEAHDGLTVAATSEVFTPLSYESSAARLTLLERHDYLAGTSFAPLLPAEVVDAPRDGAAGFDRVLALMASVRSALVYETGATDVRTTATEVLSLGRGVCQDFAHVLISLCRAEGIPSRYVSGYLYDPAVDGDQAASHAWVDVFLDGHGWISLDPTHDREQSDAYVRVAVGRDYADVPPTRGVYRGSADEALGVAVRVTAS